jgi:ribose transport system permease protein
MSNVETRARGASFNTFLLVPILLFFGLLITAALRSPSLISSSGIGSAEIVVAPLVLSTYALMATALAGRATVDLSVGPLLGFINVTLIQLGAAGLLSSPIGVFAYALSAGVAYQILFALIVIWVRVQPIIVSLSGFLALSGINLVILPRPGGTAPEWMANWGAGTSIFAPGMFMVAAATLGWLIFSTTAFHGHLRLMGADERAAYTSGVRIGIVRVGAHVVAGLFVGLAALAYTALINSGDPTQGTTYTLISVTALVLGGTSLSGGRATVLGSLLGALNLFLIGYVLATFDFGSVQGFVTDLSYGVILVLSLLLTVALPYLQRWLRYVSPLLVFLVLGLLFTGVALHATYDYTTLAPHAGVGAGADWIAAPVLEQLEQPPSFVRSPFSTRIAQVIVLLLAVVAILRILVWQSAQRRMTPLLYAAVGVGGALGLWLLMDTSAFVSRLGH